ncbi:MAG: hypothetical protein ISR65_03500 [Bacteriovoracaceae bacterium]|nr:hypothetical protein [Bacteriovoracaceae bacterium]
MGIEFEATSGKAIISMQRLGTNSNGDTITSIEGLAQDSAAAQIPYAEVAYFVEDNTAGSASGAIGMYTRQAGTWTQSMTIDGSGNVGIGTTSPSSELDVSGTVRVQQICDEAGANCKDVSGGWGSGGSVTSVASGTGLTGGPITTSGTLNVDVGTTANKVLQLDGSARIPAVDGSLLTGVNASGIVDGTIVNADIGASAAIDATKVGDGGVTTTEFGYLGSVTSDIQNQLNAKQATITTGTTSEYLRADLSKATLNTSVVPESGNLYYTDERAKAAAVADNIENAVTDVAPSKNAVFDALAGKQDVITNPVTGTGSDNRVVLWNGTTAIDASSSVSETQLDYLEGVTSNIQTQINAKLNTADERWSAATGGINYAGGDNVGIGSTSPSSRLEITATSTDANDSAINVTDSDGNTLLFVRNDGNIGIGTTSPQANLKVENSTTTAKVWAKSNTNSAFVLEDDNSIWELFLSHPDLADQSFSIGNNVGGWKRVMTMLGNGDVGIGTTSPDSRLEIKSSSTDGNDMALKVTDSDGNDLFFIRNNGQVGMGSANSNGGVDFIGNVQLDYGSSYMAVRADGSPGRLIHVSPGDWGNQSILGSTVISSIGGSAIQLNPNNGNVLGMIIDQVGKVGIGVAVPSHKLEVSDVNSEQLGLVQGGDNTNPARILLRKSRDTVVSSNYVAQGDTLGDILFQGATDGPSNFKIGASIGAIVSSGTISGSSLPTDLYFGTTSDGNVISTERMRITSSGNVAIGTTATNYNFHIKGTGNITNMALEKENDVDFTDFVFTAPIDGNDDTSGNRWQLSHRNDNEADAFHIANYWSDRNSVWNSSSYTARIAITKDGNVGIGTTGPSHKFTVAGDLTLQGTQSGPDYIYANGIGDDAKMLIKAGSTAGVWSQIEVTSNWNGSSNTEGKVAFSTVGTEQMRIDNNGNVGIGTTAPEARLHVSSDDPNLSPVVISNTGGGSSGIEIRTTGEYAYIDFAMESTSQVAGGVPDATARIWNQKGEGVSKLYFGVPVDNPKMTIQGDGDIGIGTVNPDFNLDIQGSTSTQLSLRQGGDDTTPARITMRKSRTTDVSSNYVAQGDTLGDILFQGATDGPSNFKIGAIIGTKVADGTISGSSLPTDLYFGTTSDGNVISTERMRITAGGNVGIGTTAPQGNLHIEGGLRAERWMSLYNSTGRTGEFFINAQASDSNMPTYGAIHRYANDGWDPIGSDPNTSAYEILTRASAPNTKTFLKLSSERGDISLVAANTGGDPSPVNQGIYIKSGGDVGIGTTDPGTPLDILSNSRAAVRLQTFNSTDNQDSFIQFVRRKGTSSAPLAVTSGNGLGVLAWVGYDGTSESTVSAIASVVENTVSTGSIPTALVFSTTPSGSLTPPERMRISASGNVGIGTTSPKAPLHIRSLAGSITDPNDDDNTVAIFDNPGANAVNLLLNSAEGGSNSSLIYAVNGEIQHGLTYNVAGDYLALTNNGESTAPSSGLIVNTSGNVGIATTSPDQMFVVEGNPGYSGQSTITQEGNRPSILVKGRWPNLLLNSTDTTSWNSEHGSTIGLWSHDDANDTHQWNLGGGRTGNFSIGYSKNSDNPHCGIGGYINAVDGTCDAATLTAFQINSGGNVGIGTVNSEVRLQVSGGGLCVGSDATCNSDNNNEGTLYANSASVTAADYAEYFLAEEELDAGEIVGLNTDTGFVRGYRPGDKLIGIVSKSPGIVGNLKIKRQQSVLVALMGQVSFNKLQVKLDNNVVKTHDDKSIGYLLASGDVYINLSSGNQNQEIAALKSENQAMKEVLCDLKPDAKICH